VTRKDIGAIRIHERETRFEVLASAVEGFVAALAEAVLLDNVTIAAASTKAAAVISRNAEVNAAALQWHADVDASVSPTPTVLKGAAKAALAERGIISR
jgi:hypothetical protein